MITIGKSWMRLLKAWVPGLKHPETPRTVFVNVYEYDRIRRVLTARCKICGFVVSRDEKAIKELIFQCENKDCECWQPMGSKVHQVCDLCDAMWRTLYANYGLRNMKYFREIDEKEKMDNDNARRRGGL
jgi:hypothetical protein